MTAARRDPLAGWRAWRARIEAAESVATVASVAAAVATPETRTNPPLLPPFPLLPAKANDVCTEPEAIDLGTLPDHPCQACGGRMFWRAAHPSARARRSAPWFCERCEPPDPDQWRDATCLPAR